MHVTRMPHPSSQPVYAAAALWRDRCLAQDLSLFADRPGTTLDDARALVRDFVEQPDESADKFVPKLRGQLAGTPRSAVQLAAELLYVHLLIARADVVSGDRKREIVGDVLAFAPGTAQVPAGLARALDSGLVKPGRAYNSRRWRLFGYLIETVAAVKALPPDDRRATVEDPELFVALLDTVESQGALIQRHALEHLLFPDVFPAVVSQDQRATILERWSGPAGPGTDPEPFRLARVTASLAPNGAWGDRRYTSFYRSPYRWQWEPPSAKWDALGAWAARLARDVDLDETERDYKAKASRRAREALDAAAAGTAGWPSLLKTALTKDTNVVAWQVRDPFAAWVTDEDGRAAAALAALRDDPTPPGIDAFLAGVPDEALHGTGARLSVASFLLSAYDSAAYPPWRAAAAD